MLRELVSSPSVSCTSAALDQSNLGVIEILANWLEDLNFKVSVIPLPSQPGKANLIATKGSGEGGLVFAGHTDTVPYDETGWSRDPLDVTVDDGRMYGLGTCDMKGFFPIALGAAEQFSSHRLKKPLVIVATSDEESSMAGARHLESVGAPKADVAVIGEPTDMQPIYAHKGILMLRIRLEGTSGHSSNPELGRSALDAMYEVIGAIMEFREELKRRHQDPAFSVHYPTVNLGCLNAGDNPNRICSHAELQIDVRLLPGMRAESALREIKVRLREIAETRGISVDVQTQFPPVPPYKASVDSGIVRKLESYSGRKAGTVAFGTEAPFFHRLGMETVVFGPGSIEQAHQVDEYLDWERVKPTQTVLERLIFDYCG